MGRYAVDLSDDGPRIGRMSDFVDRSYGSHEPSFLGRIGMAVGAFLRLVIPVVLLATLGGASYVYAGVPAPVFVEHPWLNVGLLVLPVTFLAVHLTSRRYGAGYAVAQVVLTFVAVTALAYFGRDQIVAALGDQRVPLRMIAGFAAGLFIAQMIAIFLFDRLRGPRWWQAPLMASLIGGIALSLIAFPVSFAGTPIDWSARMLDYMAVTSLAAVVLIIPYWVLRPLVPPRSGFGGY
ncbi:MAG TPA: VUT family protein [Rhizomicrobium sp.]|nr:VUT family protein [Rhizomicrobium sp.]